MAKRNEIGIGQEWAANHRTSPLVRDYRSWTYKVRVESTAKVKSNSYRVVNKDPWFKCEGGREVLVRKVNDDGTLGDVHAIQMSSLRMLWADWEVAKAEQDVKIARQEVEYQKSIDHYNNVEKPAFDKCMALLEKKLDIGSHSRCPFAYDEALRLIAVLEVLPDYEADEPELKLVQSA